MRGHFIREVFDPRPFPNIIMSGNRVLSLRQVSIPLLNKYVKHTTRRPFKAFMASVPMPEVMSGSMAAFFELGQEQELQRLVLGQLSFYFQLT